MSSSVDLLIPTDPMKWVDMSHFGKRELYLFFTKTLADSKLYISTWQLTQISKEEESGGEEGRGERELVFHSETLQSYAVHLHGPTTLFNSFPQQAVY